MYAHDNNDSLLPTSYRGASGQIDLVGGGFWLSPTPAITAGITKSVASLLGEITTQYVLRYVPDADFDPRASIFRRIKVEVPSLSGVTIRARDGYFPNPVAPLPKQ